MPRSLRCSSRRGFNIESLGGGSCTEDLRFIRSMTIVVNCERAPLEQDQAAGNKLINVKSDWCWTLNCGPARDRPGRSATGSIRVAAEANMFREAQNRDV